MKNARLRLDQPLANRVADEPGGVWMSGLSRIFAIPKAVELDAITTDSSLNRVCITDEALRLHTLHARAQASLTPNPARNAPASRIPLSRSST